MSSRGRSPRELLKAKGYMWPYIPSQVLIRTLYNFNNHFAKRRSGQSASEYSLLLKKPPSVNKKILTTPKVGLKKTVSVIAFRIAVTLDVKNGWFGRQVAVCVNKRHKNANFGFSRFQKFNFDCLLLKLLICLSITENIFSFVCPLWNPSSGMISGTQIYSTLFLALSHKSGC